jgi:hypothetical protein
MKKITKNPRKAKNAHRTKKNRIETVTFDIHSPRCQQESQTNNRTIQTTHHDNTPLTLPYPLRYSFRHIAIGG